MNTFFKKFIYLLFITFLVYSAGCNNPDNPNKVLKFHLYGIYPLPVSSNATINYWLSEDIPVTIIIIDTYGRTVMNILNNRIQAGKKEHYIQIDCSSLQSGLYFLILKSGDDYDSRQFSVIK